MPNKKNNDNDFDPNAEDRQRYMNLGEFSDGGGVLNYPETTAEQIHDNLSQINAQENTGFPYEKITGFIGQHKVPIITALTGIGLLSYFLNRLNKPKQEGIRVPNKK